MLMGNDIAGGKVTPTLEIVDVPQPCDPEVCAAELYPTCLITRAQAHQSPDVDLSESFLSSKFSDAPELNPETQAGFKVSLENQAASLPKLEGLPCTRDRLRTEQKADPTLHSLFSCVVSGEQCGSLHLCYFLDDDILMRK